MQIYCHPHTHISPSFLPYTMSSFLIQNTPNPFLTIPTSPKPKPCRSSLHFTTHAGPPARDRVIDFGKYKGKMLGTLPSTYLRWVSNNLRARDFEEWANLADQVLQDPVYNDRVEWEFAEKLLHGNSNIKSEGTVVSELLEISQRFGWDNEDKVGWSKVDFQLLGSSRGGRIPRVKGEKEGKTAKMEKVMNGGDSRRGERRERVKMRRSMQKNVHGVSFLQRVIPSPTGPHTLTGGNDEEVVKPTQVNNKHGASFLQKAMPSPIGPHILAGRNDEELDKLTQLKNKRGASFECRNVGEGEGVGSKSDENEKVYSPFPGRESLVRKALNRRSDF